MRQIIAASKKGHARAKLASNIFMHRLRRAIGEMVAVPGASTHWSSPQASAKALRKFVPPPVKN